MVIFGINQLLKLLPTLCIEAEHQVVLDSMNHERNILNYTRVQQGMNVLKFQVYSLCFMT